MGFDPHQVNPPAAIEHLRVFYIVLPILLAMLSLSVMLGYPLDEARQQRLRDEIERMRRTHVSAEDIVPPGLLPGGAALASDSETVAHLAPDRPPN